MDSFLRAIDRLNDVIGKILALLIIPMILVVLYAAIMRYAFNAAVNWGFEIALFAFGIHCILGGGYTMLHNGHVNVDILTARLPYKWGLVISLLGKLTAVFVVAIILYLGIGWAYKSTLILEHSIHGTEFNPPIWWYKWTVPLSAFLILLQCIAQIIRDICGLFSTTGDNGE